MLCEVNVPAAAHGSSCPNHSLHLMTTYSLVYTYWLLAAAGTSLTSIHQIKALLRYSTTY